MAAPSKEAPPIVIARIEARGIRGAYVSPATLDELKFAAQASRPHGGHRGLDDERGEGQAQSAPLAAAVQGGGGVLAPVAAPDFKGRVR